MFKNRLYMLIFSLALCCEAFAMPFPWLEVDDLPEDILSVQSDFVTGNVFFAISQSQGIFKTSDNGDTWSNIGSPENKAVISLVRDPIATESWYSIVAASDGVYEIWYSSDNCSSWGYRSLCPGNPQHLIPSNLADDNVFLSVREVGQENHILLKSEDKALTWHSVLSIPNPGFAPVWNSSAIWQAYWGTYVSNDYGETWASASDKAISSCGFGIPPALYAPTSDGLFRSTDNLLTWWPLTTNKATFTRLNPKNPDQIFTGSLENSQNIILSTDGGETFQNWSGPFSTGIQDVYFGNDWMYFLNINGKIYRYDERPADLDNTNRVDGGDLVILSTAFGTFAGDDGYNAEADLNNDGAIDGSDLVILSAVFGHRFSYDSEQEPGDFPDRP